MPEYKDMRKDHFRGSYWIQKTEEPESPTKSDKLRVDKLNHEATRKIYSAKWKSWPGPSGKIAGGSSLDSFPRGHLTDKMMDSTGSVRSLPTQIPELPRKVNVNHLRAAKEQVIWEDVFTGERTYTPKALTGNFNEERFDRSYLHGFGTQMFKRRYETTALAMNKQATPAFQERLARANMYAKQPDPQNDVRSAFAPHNNYINYARPECKDSRARDFSLTSPKRGAAWVGTAPVDPFVTTNSIAYGKHEKHPFQARCASADPRSRLLCSIAPEHKPPRPQLEQYNNKWTNARLPRNRFTTEYAEHFDKTGATMLQKLRN